MGNYDRRSTVFCRNDDKVIKGFRCMSGKNRQKNLAGFLRILPQTFSSNPCTSSC